MSKIKVYEIKGSNLNLKKDKTFRNSKNQKLIYDERTEEQIYEFEKNKHKSFSEILDENMKRR